MHTANKNGQEHSIRLLLSLGNRMMNYQNVTLNI